MISAWDLKEADAPFDSVDDEISSKFILLGL
jgi:hypothetical protein